MEQWMEPLYAHDQTQVLKFYDTLTQKEQDQLKAQVESLDFQILEEAKKAGERQKAGEISFHQTMRLPEIEAKKEAYFAAGKAALDQGKVAALILAGGQGTRLQYNGPKGKFNLGTEESPKYIFQILLENMEENQRGLSHKMPLYIMTSDLNHQETTEFFHNHQYFGYPPELVKFFQQDNAPALDADFKMLMNGKGSIALQPSGNGGWFTSLVRAGLIQDMEDKGVEWINVVSVDNILQNIGDPVYVGACIREDKPCGAKVIRKVSPGEKVGAICLRGGRPSVVEYSELTEEMRQAKDAKGDYLYDFGVTLNYLFRLKETKEAAKNPLPVHLAFKAIDTIDEAGKRVSAKAPNAYKLEYFIFDILESFDSCLSFEVRREDEFAPIKNATGEDSVATAKALYTQKKGYVFPF